MSHRHDPRLLFSVAGISAFHIQHGDETPLTPSGPQTLSLLLVPTGAEEDLIGGNGSGSGETGSRPESPEVDFYLHLHLPPELDIPLPATTQVFHQPPSSYLIPRWDLGHDSGAFTRIEFPKVGSGPDRVSQEDIDTFETILAQCTAFAEKAPAPVPRDHKPYNPSDFKAKEGYVSSGEKGTSSSAAAGHGQLVLIDEENGSVVGELGQGYQIDEKAGIKPGDKTPVEIQMPEDGQPQRITVSPVSEDYLTMSRHPAYASSRIVQNAAMASRLIVTGSNSLSRAMTSGAQSFSSKTKPAAKPMTFSPAAQERIRKINNMTHGAVGLSAATIGQINKVAQGVGAKLTRRDQAKHERSAAASGGVDKHGRPLPKADYKPGVLNKSLIAFSTLADSVEESAKQLLATGGAAGSHMVTHRYGTDAGKVASHLTSSIRHVSLVFIDAQGVSRRAVLKSVAKGMVVGRMPNGQQVVVGDGDGGLTPQEFGGDGKEGQYATGTVSHSGSGPLPPRSATPNSALEAARLQAHAQSSAASGAGAGAAVPPPAYSDPSGVGSRFSDAKHR